MEKSDVCDPRVEYVKTPRTGDELLRLDLNENVLGCSPKVIEALKQVKPTDVSVYPDTSVFRTELAQFLGVEDGNILMTNGADEAIRYIMDQFLKPGDEVVMAEPTFSMYPVFCSQLKVEIRSVNYNDDLSFPTEALIGAITPRTKMIVLVSPNNPTGTSIELPDLRRICEATDAKVLLDEAYFEFGEIDAMDVLADYRNLVLVRTFSKVYGLAGLRLGYMIADRSIISSIEQVSAPYNVNNLAVIAARAALSDQKFTTDYVQMIQQNRDYLAEKLPVKTYPSQANFLVADMGEYRVEIWNGLRERGILVRDLASFKLLGNCIRIGVGTKEMCDTVVGAIEQITGGCQ